MALNPALLMASRRRGSVSSGLLPMEHVAYERGILWREFMVGG